MLVIFKQPLTQVIASGVTLSPIGAVWLEEDPQYDPTINVVTFRM